MGNANCMLKNDTDQPQQIKVFNYADCIRTIPRYTTTIQPGVTQKAEAAAHFDGLIIQVKGLDKAIGNGRTVNIGSILNDGKRGHDFLCGTVARVRQMKEAFMKHGTARLVKVWAILYDKGCVGHAGIMMEFENGMFATLDFIGGAGLRFGGMQKSKENALAGNTWHIHNNTPKAPPGHTDLEDVYNYLEEEWHGVYYSFGHRTKWHNRSNCYGFRDHICEWIERRPSNKRRRT
jgi:hypothetical protein